jgi:hypothetical protein
VGEGEDVQEELLGVRGDADGSGGLGCLDLLGLGSIPHQSSGAGGSSRPRTGLAPPVPSARLGG